MKQPIKIALFSAFIVALVGLANTSLASNQYFANPSSIAPDSGAGSISASYNWAGYTAAGGTYTGVNGSWVIPNVPTSNNFSADATWVGIGGMSSQDLIQVGTQAIVNGQGQISYQPWYELLPSVSQPINITVNPGDSITASISKQAGSQWQINLKDNTTGQSYQTTVTYDSSLSSAEWIEEMPSQTNGSFIPLDNFGGVDVTSATATKNGNILTASDANAQPISMLNTSREVLASPTQLGTDGSSFIVTRSNATATPASVIRKVSFGRRGWQRSGVGVDGYTTQSDQPSSYTIPDSSSLGFSQQELDLLRQQLEMLSQLSNMRITFSFSR